jgi:hypothetical protein
MEVKRGYRGGGGGWREEGKGRGKVREGLEEVREG